MQKKAKKKQNDKHKRNVNHNKQALEESCALFPNLKRLCGSQAKLITKEAIKLRNEGKYFDSLHKFNEALTNAPSFYESSSIYAERAAVYYSLKQFKHFRNNIRLAIDNNHPYPAKLRKWEKAAGKLDLAADEQHPADDFFKLSHPPNEKIPFVADCLELKEDAIFRYRLTTSQHLKVGDVIALDKPFSKMVQIDSRYQQCGNCLKQNRLDLIPCRCKFIMFCSEKCKDEASNGFHALECQDINGVMLTEDLLWFHLAMKTLMEAVSLFDDDPNDLKVFLSEKLSSSQKMQKVFESLMGFSANNLLKAKNLLKNSKLLPQAATLWSFDWTDDSFVEYKRLLVANALDAKLNVEYRHNKGMHRLVERFTADFKQFDRIIKRSECKDFGTEFILKHSNNLYVKSEKSEDGYWTWNGGLYFMRNFMTFGCMPNVKGFIKDGGDMVLIVTAPIVANGTLFIDYE